MSAAIQRRAELTFKGNHGKGRHDWFRLTPAYSLEIVRLLLAEEESGARVVDPFSGTGTTAVCASNHGFDAVGVDINPLLVWLGNAKAAHYSPRLIAETSQCCDDLLAAIRVVTPATPPALHRIERWWAPPELEFLCRVKAAIDRVAPIKSKRRDLLLLAFCRTLIEISNAAFNHQSMSFKDAGETTQRRLFTDEVSILSGIYKKNLNRIIGTAAVNPKGSAKVVLGDSLEIEKALADEERFDVLVTSPPYPNRMSYIRELRPYMYWLGYLEDARAAGDLDWQSIGGTWGVATSRLTNGSWRRDQTIVFPEHLETAIMAVSRSHEKNGPLLANYLAKYFEDMWQHFHSVRMVLRPGARIHYIVGNATFYGVEVRAQEVYREMLQHVGFADSVVVPMRKRNSKTELFEYRVSGHLSEGTAVSHRRVDYSGM